MDNKSYNPWMKVKYDMKRGRYSHLGSMGNLETALHLISCLITFHFPLNYGTPQGIHLINPTSTITY